MVPKHVHKHLPLLQYMAQGKPRIVRALIQEADSEVLRVLCECCKTVINEGVNLDRGQIKKLRRYRQQLRLLSKKRTSVKQKKQALQRGGFLGALLGAVVPTLISAVSSLVRS